MKILQAAAFAALLLAAPVVATAAPMGHTVGQPANQSQFGADAGDPPAVSFLHPSRSPRWTSSLEYQSGVPLRPLVGLSTNPIVHPLDSTMALVNATGNGR
jgi:hypothetical protein